MQLNIFFNVKLFVIYAFFYPVKIIISYNSLPIFHYKFVFLITYNPDKISRKNTVRTLRFYRTRSEGLKSTVTHVKR